MFPWHVQVTSLDLHRGASRAMGRQCHPKGAAQNGRISSSHIANGASALTHASDGLDRCDVVRYPCSYIQVTSVSTDGALTGSALCARVTNHIRRTAQAQTSYASVTRYIARERGVADRGRPRIFGDFAGECRLDMQFSGLHTTRSGRAVESP